MNALLTNEVLQALTWMFGLLELILAIYVLILNPRHTVNRHTAFLLFVFALNALGLGLLFGATHASQAVLPTVLLSMTTEPAKVGLLLLTLLLLEPQWLQGRRQWLRWLLYAFLFLPMLLTLGDVLWQSGLWYSGVDVAHYTGGYVSSTAYETGSVAQRVRPLYMYVLALLPFVPILWHLIVRHRPRATRRLASLLLVLQMTVVVVQLGLRPLLSLRVTVPATSLIVALGYAFVVLGQMMSGPAAQFGRLHRRLIALVLGVTLPILVVLVGFVIYRFSMSVNTWAEEALGGTSHLVANSTRLWWKLNLKALQQLVAQPEIRTMDPVVQKPVLAAMAAVYENIYLVSTTDLSGKNVARSDEGALADYSDRLWFQAVRDGASVAYQVVIGRTSGKPALVVAMPIHDSTGRLAGVGMFAMNLETLPDELHVERFGETGVTYVVDAEYRIIAHPDPAYSERIVDLRDSPIASKLYEVKEGWLRFTDADGRQWEAHIDGLDNGWVVVAQQESAELQRPLIRLIGVSLLGLILSGALIAGLIYLTVRQTIRPINVLTETATAIAQGDLTRTAPVVREDEIGLLARAFNSMTAQLREFIGTLEQRVASRTADLERRSAYLAASAEVSRAAVSVLDPDTLVAQVVDLIRERFGLYYVGLFLVDETRTWAELRSGTGEAGRAMLARHHRIRVGEGMVGWCIAHATARIASHAEIDEVRLRNPELPDTRSEAALPLRSREQVLGALTVQSVHPDAFDPEFVAVLQTMADQVAVALDNARLLAQAQVALEAERRAYGLIAYQDWSRLLRARAEVGYVGVRQTPATSDVEILVAQGDWTPEMRAALQTRQGVPGRQDGRPTFAVPIITRDQVVGVLNFTKDESVTAGTHDAAVWTREEITLFEALAGQLGQALEAARLYRQTQIRAARESAIREITDRMQRATDIEALMAITAEALNQTLGGSHVYVRMGTPADVDTLAVAGGQTDGTDGGDNGNTE